MIEQPKDYPNHRNRQENLDYCIHYLLQQSNEPIAVPPSLDGKTRLLRALMNLWQPCPLSNDYLCAQDAELHTQLAEKGVVNPSSFNPLEPSLYLWQGDITRLHVDAIVNAANSRMMGCWHPLHGCIDNAIHSAAGLQLRSECAEKMSREEWTPTHPEYSFNGKTYKEAFTSEAIITKAYNLPSQYVIHTVGPIIPDGRPTPKQEQELADCYRNSIALALSMGCNSIAFCCISTGEFRFPNHRAAEIAVNTVRQLLAASHAPLIVVFNVFKTVDYDIYSKLLGTH